MKVKPLRPDLIEFIQNNNLQKKWEKIVRLFAQNIKHPSLHTELLEPRWRGIYSFRIDRKYRALFFISKGIVEIFQITKHYKKS